MINMRNVLRFFPIYTLRNYTDTVIVTVYWEGRVYTRMADRMDGGRFWEVLLPEFELGEGIQRIEVDTRFSLPDVFKRNTSNMPASSSICEDKTSAYIAEQMAPAPTDLPPNDRPIEHWGPGVTEADVIVDATAARARVLYRNYKPEVRHLLTMDPGEQLGVFRARFVPFAVVQGDLKRPLVAGSTAIFEIGLAFGDQVVSGDEFIQPEFSLKRLGVAFAITEKLFDTSAKVMALVVTYDFSTYGSVGVGANFPHGRSPESYISVGINRIAFQRGLREIERLFR
jgi:hypothetical protein